MTESGHITIACVYWKGYFRAPKYNYPGYSLEWIEKLRNMVARNITVPYEFVCLSNHRFTMEGVRVIPLQHGLKGWWSKLELFRKDLPIKPGRVLYLDLDVIVLSDLMPFINYDSTMAILSSFVAIDETELKGIVRGYNSSVMVYDYPLRRKIWSKFVKSKKSWKRRYRGDQDFLMAILPSLSTFPKEWVMKLGSCINDKGQIKLNEEHAKMKIMLCMPLKNRKAARRFQFVRKYWQ